MRICGLRFILWLLLPLGPTGLNRLLMSRAITLYCIPRPWSCLGMAHYSSMGALGPYYSSIAGTALILRPMAAAVKL